MEKFYLLYQDAKRIKKEEAKLHEIAYSLLKPVIQKFNKDNKAALLINDFVALYRPPNTIEILLTDLMDRHTKQYIMEESLSEEDKNLHNELEKFVFSNIRANTKINITVSISPGFFCK